MVDNKDLENALEKKVADQSKTVSGSLDLNLASDEEGTKKRTNDLDLAFGQKYSNFINYDEILHWARPIDPEVLSKFKENVLFKDESIVESNSKKDGANIPPHLSEVEQEKEKFFNDLETLKIELGVDIIEQEELKKVEEENKEIDFEDEELFW